MREQRRAWAPGAGC
uniref:Uncharacterized protein n=1 Tax=Arundo donax TaxID=35708 RepID=A0A0A9C9F1_ARUDO